MIELTKMLAAIEACKAIGKPLIEYRMHPDDYRALKEQTKIQRSNPTDDYAPSHIWGLRIVLDTDAPRLPRKA